MSSRTMPTGLATLASLQAVAGALLFIASVMALIGVPFVGLIDSCCNTPSGSQAQVAQAHTHFLLVMTVADIAAAVPHVLASIAILASWRIGWIASLIAAMAMIANAVTRVIAGNYLIAITAIEVIGGAWTIAYLCLPRVRIHFSGRTSSAGEAPPSTPP